MVSVLTSPDIIAEFYFCSWCKAKRTSNGARFDKPDIIAEFYFRSYSVKQNGHQMVPVFVKPDIIAEFYFYSCSVKQNGHQMVSVLTSPILLQNSTFVVV